MVVFTCDVSDPDPFWLNRATPRRRASGYTQALTDLEGLGARMDHQPVPSGYSLICGIATALTRSRRPGSARTRPTCSASTAMKAARGSPARFPPLAPGAGVGGDAAILSFPERQDYPAERLAADDAVSDFDGSAVLVTRFVAGAQLPYGVSKFAMMGELLGRLHALPYDESASRPGGASGEDPCREGTPRQDLLAALSFLDAVDTKVPAAAREQLRDQVRSADDGDGLPEGLLHGNLLHAADHAVLSDQGPVAINWKASGRGPRLADFAYLIWGAGSWRPPGRPNGASVGVLQRPRLRRRARPPARQPCRPRPAPLGSRDAPRERPAPAEDGLGEDRPGRLCLPRGHGLGRPRHRLPGTRPEAPRRPRDKDHPDPARTVKLLRAHIKRYGTTPGGRIFQTARGSILQDSAYGAVWTEARKEALTGADAANKRITDALRGQDTQPESSDEGDDDSEQAP
jgi:hypothetical protein